MNSLIKKLRGDLCTLVIASGIVTLLVVDRVAATTYGGTGANTTFYSAAPIILADGDTVVGFAELAGGFHTTGGGASVTLTNVAAPIAKDIYIGSGDTINFTGDLTLTTTSIQAGGDFTITPEYLSEGQGWSPSLFLDHDTFLPACTITVGDNLVIDGRGHTLTFNSSTLFALNSKNLTLKNMVIKALSGNSQFGGSGTLVLQNCIIDVPYGITFAYDSANVTIADDVLFQGGGTFRFGGVGTLTINSYSTLAIDHDTTLDYNCVTRGLISMNDATSTIHINGGTLKAQGVEGLQLTYGRLFLENQCILDNGTNSNMANSIQLGDGSSDLTVKILAGACVAINGCVWHNPS